MKFSFNNTSLKERMKAKHAKKDTYKRYRGMFYFMSFVGWVCMAVSALAGTEFYYSMVEAKMGVYGYGLAGFVSALIVVAIWWFSDHVADLWFEEKAVDVFVVFMLATLALTFYTDFNGSIEIAEKIEDSPTDGVSGGISESIKSVEAKESKIYDFYGWCSVHGEKHLSSNENCKSLVKPSTPAQLRGLKKHGYDVNADRAKLAGLEKEKSVYLSQLETQTGKYIDELSNFNDRLDRRKSTYKGVSIIANFVMVLITFFQSYWGVKVGEESETPPLSSGERNLRQLETELADVKEERRLMEEREKAERKLLETARADAERKRIKAEKARAKALKKLEKARASAEADAGK